MRRPRLLVLTTVHSPDDTRIRERLIRTLDQEFVVSYATRSPGPSNRAGLRWVELRGGRMRRNLTALTLVLRGGWDLLVLHDPETIPSGVVARLLYKRPVVFDVHEDLVAQIESKPWAPARSRRFLRWFSSRLFWIAERALTLTLAEAGYRRLFAREHPVFPNYPRAGDWPDPEPGSGSAVYVGDVTEERGVRDAIAACRSESIPLEIVGPVKARFTAADDALVSFTGRLEHADALRYMQHASVGLSPLRAEPNYTHSMPTKVLEYLAMGLPVVATNLPGTRAVLEGLDAVWLVEPGNVELMAEAIVAASSVEAGAAARRQAPTIRRRFTWPDEAVLHFYRSLLETQDPS